MIRFLPLALLLGSGVSALAFSGLATVAQRKPLTIADNVNPALVDTSVTAPDLVANQRPSNRIDFEASGGVVAISKSRGITMRAQKMKGSLEPDPVSPRKGALRLGDLTATGDFALDRKTFRTGARGIPVASRLTQIRSEIGTYTTPGRDDVFLTLTGGMKIVDNSKAILTRTGSDMTISGNSGNATLKNTAKESTLQKATVRNNVAIAVLQQSVDSAGKVVLTPYNAKGDLLQYTATENGGATVTLTGNLDFSSPGSTGGGGAGVITGATKAVLTLNAKNEVTNVRLSNDAPQARVKTTFKLKKNPARS